VVKLEGFSQLEPGSVHPVVRVEFGRLACILIARVGGHVRYTYIVLRVTGNGAVAAGACCVRWRGGEYVFDCRRSDFLSCFVASLSRVLARKWVGACRQATALLRAQESVSDDDTSHRLVRVVAVGLEQC
jgi:hypothetical protein